MYPLFLTRLLASISARLPIACTIRLPNILTGYPILSPFRLPFSAKLPPQTEPSVLKNQQGLMLTVSRVFTTNCCRLTHCRRVRFQPQQRLLLTAQLIWIALLLLSFFN